MSYPGQLFEDPFYDEDGVLVDEDAPLDEDELALIQAQLADYDPFSTVNS